MELVRDYELEKQPVDEATKAALREVEAQGREKNVTMEQSTANLQRRLKEWRKKREEIAA